MKMADETTKKSALIIGASRGLGLGLAKELLGRGWNVTATVRAATGGTGLEGFHEQVTMDTVDINDLATVNAFVDRVADTLFDVVFINAGIGGPEGKTAETVAESDVTHLFMTNAIAPVRLAYKLLHTVKPKTGILVFMSSILGSVELSTSGYAVVYSASKAALNCLTRNFVATEDCDDITVLTMHPGWVRTEMGGANADIDVETSVKGMADVLEAEAGAGGHQFLNYKGETIPW
jgi:NAD(P)-dependent dehydrogenase (short-subunit alcohol dehydrogenase family)